MKLNIHRIKNVSLTLMGLGALIALTGAGVACTRWRTESDRPDDPERITYQLARIADTQAMLKALSAGKTESLRQTLCFQLAEDIADLQQVTAWSDDDAARFAKYNCDRIVSEAKAHPEIYLAGSPRTRAAEQKAWQLATAANNQK